MPRARPGRSSYGHCTEKTGTTDGYWNHTDFIRVYLCPSVVPIAPLFYVEIGRAYLLVFETIDGRHLYAISARAELLDVYREPHRNQRTTGANIVGRAEHPGVQL